MGTSVSWRLLLSRRATSDRRLFRPDWEQVSFFSGYRIFTRYRTTAGRTLRGLRILRSDTDRLSMQLFGNLLAWGACGGRSVIAAYVIEWQSGVAEIGRVLKPEGRFFFEEVTRAALNRWLYRTFLDHPAENRFSEAEFLSELAIRGMEPVATPRRILANDIFIGIAQRR